MDRGTPLERRFREAKLELELLPEPISRGPARRGLQDIVQIDIARPPRRASERFQIYRGARENRVDALGVDTARRQLVLFVDEPRRPFEVTVARHVKLAPDTRVIRETKTSRVIEQFTEARKRHFLCGMDEAHLFIAELPYGVSSVHGARDALRAPEVPPNLHVRDGRVVRQGEWFFLPCARRDRAEVEAAIRAGALQRTIGIAEAARINRAGRPHVADEVVAIKDDAAANGVRMFVRGDVRHPDHKTVRFPQFVRAVPNRERFAQPAGVFWID
jgi:hypothetical protein